MLVNNFTIPQSPFDRPAAYAPNQPSPNFVWGQGGARLTPEQVLAEQELANARMRADFSPVGSVWEGLGRVADNWLGAVDSRRIDKEQAANAERSNGVLQALMGAPDQATLISAAADPYLDSGARGVATLLLKNSMRKAQQPNDFERLLLGAGIQPGTPQWAEANRQRAESLYDPTVNANVGGRDFFGPRSLLLNNLGGGGDPTSGVTPGATPNPPATLPPDFDFGNGGPTPPASGRFR